MSFYLLDNPNPHGRFFYPTRQVCQHGYTGPHLIVLHTAENLPDFVGEDTGGESIARYAATTKRTVSWHVTIDSDSVIPMLPSTATAWHVRGFNRCSVGYEMATQAHMWTHVPQAWREGIYDNVADQLAADSVALGIPLIDRRAEPEKWGVTTHSVLDPTRRSDPGVAFPFEWILQMARTGWRYSRQEIITPDHWAQRYTEILVEAGLVDKADDYRLDEHATRAELFAVVARLLARG